MWLFGKIKKYLSREKEREITNIKNKKENVITDLETLKR